MGWMRCRVFVLLIALALACQRRTPTDPPVVASASATTPSVIPSRELSPEPLPEAAPPLATSPSFEALDVLRHARAVVSIPNGATSRRPVLVALHGKGDRPERTCDAWRNITKARAWIVCPRGTHNAEWSTASDERFAFTESIPDLAKHVDLALVALVAKYPEHVDAEHPILVGFSMGAVEVVQIATRDPGRWTRIALVEGGYDTATGLATALAHAKIVRVLFGAGQADNAQSAKVAAARLEAAGVPARCSFAKVGHSIDRPLQDQLDAHLAWFTEGDDRWSK